jgi:hypothetical protein
MFESQREHLLRSLDVAHDAYYRAGTFGGPSFHFHLRALGAGKDGGFEQFAEMAYALLVAWGMLLRRGFLQPQHGRPERFLFALFQELVPFGSLF